MPEADVITFPNIYRQPINDMCSVALTVEYDHEAERTWWQRLANKAYFTLTIKVYAPMLYGVSPRETIHKHLTAEAVCRFGWLKQLVSGYGTYRVDEKNIYADPSVFEALRNPAI